VNPCATKRRKKPSEEGYILVAVMFMLAMLIIAMAVAVPRIREDIQRDRDMETMHRGMQYARAIKLYYKKFNAYPPSVDALVKTNEIRFLRKRYADPITGKDDWKPIMLGQQKTPVVMGFFGQALAGSGLAGTGPGGVAGASSIGSSFMSGNSSTGSTGTGGAFSGGNSASGGSSMFGSSGTGAASGAGTGTTGGTSTGTGSGTAGSDSGSGNGISTNQTFGGGGIIGFSPGSERESILIYKKKNHYNEWEFLYSPLQDQKTIVGGNAGTIGTPVGAPNGTGTGFGTSPSGSPSAPTSPMMPTSPQQ
jgi:type II secretory pathway pseudopilin PulG